MALTRDEFLSGRSRLSKQGVFDLPDYNDCQYPILQKEDLINCYRIVILMNGRVSDPVQFWQYIESVLLRYPTLDSYLKSSEINQQADVFKSVIEYAYAAAKYDPRPVPYLTQYQEDYLNQVIKKFSLG